MWWSAIGGGILLFDPLNIRLRHRPLQHAAVETRTTRSARCCSARTGHMVLWDYHRSPFLADHLPLVREVRSGASFFYFGAGRPDAGPGRGLRGRGARADGRARGRETAASASTRSWPTACARWRVWGSRSWRARRRPSAPAPSRGADEIRAHALRHPRRRGRPVAAMQEVCGPRASARTRSGRCCTPRTSAAAASGSRRGSWPSGPRTNPWFQECGPRVVQPNEGGWPSTPISSAATACAWTSRAPGGSAPAARAPTWSRPCATPASTSRRTSRSSAPAWRCAS